jgi:hypothetical protein
LSPELVFGYQHRLLTPDELRAVHDHIDVCETCREELADTMQAEEMVRDIRSALTVPRRPARRFLPYTAAAAAILVIAGSSIWWSRYAAKRRVIEDGSDEPSVQQALRSGRIALPAFLDQLAPARETLMGSGGAAPPARLLSPMATAVLGPSVRFRWEPVEGQWTYQVRIFQLSGEPVLASPELTGTEWILEQGLSPGSDFQWQLIASRGSERVTLPGPPSTPPRFRVLDNATTRRLRALAFQHPSAHLLLGVEYGQAGAIDDAKAQLSLAAGQKPNPNGAKRLLDSLIPLRQ